MEQEKYFSFTERETALYPNYRPMYKVAQILLILLYNGYKGKASLLKLHLFSWALKSQDNLVKLKEFASSTNSGQLHFFGIESTLNRALNLAYAEGLISFDSGSYSLLSKGKKFAEEVSRDDSLFVFEKEILKSIKNKISERVINTLVNQWKNA